MISELETTGIWRVHRLGKLVRVWENEPIFVPNELDVAFKYGPHFNYGMPGELRDKFYRDFRVIDIFEILEVFREPNSDMDASFRGRYLVVARFDDLAAATYFKMQGF